MSAPSHPRTYSPPLSHLLPPTLAPAPFHPRTCFPISPNQLRDNDLGRFDSGALTHGFDRMARSSGDFRRSSILSGRLLRARRGRRVRNDPKERRTPIRPAHEASIPGGNHVPLAAHGHRRFGDRRSLSLLKNHPLSGGAEKNHRPPISMLGIPLTDA